MQPVSNNSPHLTKELLGSLELRILNVQRSRVEKWWNYQQVVSPYSRLWLVLGGRARARHHGREFQLTPGHVYLVPAFTEHDCSCANYLDHFHLHFVSRLPTGIDLFSLIECDYQMPAPAATLGFLERLEKIFPDRKLPCFNPFESQYQEFSAKAEQSADKIPPTDWLEAQGALKLLLTPFLRTARSREDVHARAASRFGEVQEYIHDHMQESIRLADLAKVARLHPTYFSDRFHELVGMRPLDYLMRRRLERAQYLLLTSAATVKEVAFAVGLRDPAYFSRVFTRACKMSPREYRASHGN